MQHRKAWPCGLMVWQPCLDSTLLPALPWWPVYKQAQVRVGRISVVEKRGKRGILQDSVLGPFHKVSMGISLGNPVGFHDIIYKENFWSKSTALLLNGSRIVSGLLLLHILPTLGNVEWLGNDQDLWSSDSRVHQARTRAWESGFSEAAWASVSAQKPECAFCVQGAWKVVALSALF